MLRIIEKCSDPRSRIISKINELRSKQCVCSMWSKWSKKYNDTDGDFSMSYIKDIADAICRIRPNSQFTVQGQNENTINDTLTNCKIDWSNNEEPISSWEVNLKI